MFHAEFRRLNHKVPQMVDEITFLRHSANNFAKLCENQKVFHFGGTICGKKIKKSNF